MSLGGFQQSSSDRLLRRHNSRYSRWESRRGSKSIPHSGMVFGCFTQRLVDPIWGTSHTTPHTCSELENWQCTLNTYVKSKMSLDYFISPLPYQDGPIGFKIYFQQARKWHKANVQMLLPTKPRQREKKSTKTDKTWQLATSSLAGH